MMSCDKPELIIAICSLIVSIVAIVISICIELGRRKHNKLSVKPICLIKFNDREDFISVELKNVGIGPMFIESDKVTGGEMLMRNLIDALPDPPSELSYDDFVGKPEEFTLSS